MRGGLVRLPFRRWLLPVLILVASMPALTVRAQDAHSEVLVLYSTRRDSQFAITGETILPRTLDVGLGRAVDYYAEHIDLSRFPDSAYTSAFRDFLRLKYEGIRFDLVIAMQDAATAFVRQHRDALFPGTPVVFLANDPATPRLPNAAGLIQQRNYGATVTLLRRLQPDVRHLFVVTGAAAGDWEYQAEAAKQLQSLSSGLTLTYLTGLPTQQLENRLSRLPERSAVYYVLVSSDGDGNRFHPLDYVARVATAANAPTYSWVDSAIGQGILGGSLYSQQAAIEHVGRLALRVLRGERADAIPLSVLDLHIDQVDWRQLRRWEIDEARLPPGTRVRFREPTIWDEYSSYILAALAVLLTQTVLIAALLLQRRRRRQAEDQLRGSERELLRSHERNRDLGARLLRAQEDEHARIARELHDDICQRMSLLTIELETLTGRSDGPAAEALTLAQDIARSLHELSHRLHPTRLRLIGLVSALDQLRQELSRAGMAIRFTHDNVPPALPPDVMLCLFRVVQEALGNAIKYSNATDVRVHLIGGGDGLTLTVSDDGVGFDVDAAWGKGLGLVSMEERIEAIGGSLEIRSKPGLGTCLIARVPRHVVASADPPRLVA